MKKKLLILIVLILSYYFCTFLLSFVLISKYIVNNDSVSLDSFINNNDIEKNFYSDIYELRKTFYNKTNKKIEIQNNLFKFTGEITPAFIEKLFLNLSSNISKDLSEANTILYFYFNSNELSKYLNKSLNNLGDYNFKRYLVDQKLENKKEVEKKISTKSDNNINVNKKEEKNNEFKIIISKLIKKYKYTDYFFLTTPIHFKLAVLHQDLFFVVMLKFNGFKWKLNSITIPYDKLIDKKTNLIN